VTEETIEPETRELAKPSIGMGDRGLALRTLDDATRFATGVIASGLAPRDFDTVARVIVAMQFGAEIGFGPMQSLQSIAVINGKPSLYGDALPALGWSSGLLEDLNEYFEDEDTDNPCAVCDIKRRDADTRIVRRFSKAMAEQAGLWGKRGPWSDYRFRMLQMRARSWAFRDGLADALRGVAVQEEVRDYREPLRVDVAPSPAVGDLDELE